MLTNKMQERLDKWRNKPKDLQLEKKIPTARLPVFIARRGYGDEIDIEKERMPS